MTTPGARQILNGGGLTQELDKLSHEILNTAGSDTSRLAIIGIRRRGVPLAERIAKIIQKTTGQPVQTGALDITLYRDDLTLVADQPVVRATEIDFPIDGMHIVLCDDVLFTGRTVRSAIDALFALGRPAKIELAVLVDRGFRELPIQANYVGRKVETGRDEIVHVHLTEVDGQDLVEIVAPVKGATS